jgi:hypothetical protein
MVQVIDFASREANTVEGEERCAEMVERVEEMLAYVKAGMVKSLGLAAVFQNSTIYSANLHIGQQGMELGAAIMSLQHDYICAFNDAEKPSLPTTSVEPMTDADMPYQKWHVHDEPMNETHLFANPEE